MTTNHNPHGDIDDELIESLAAEAEQGYDTTQLRPRSRRGQSPLQHVFEHYPWDVQPHHRDNTPNTLFRYHAHYMATGGRGMPTTALTALAAFYRHIQNNNLVLDYNPTTGFTYLPRRDTDGDLIIHVNPRNTRLTGEGLMLWRFPPRMP